ncbi:uncharacterized protein K02A2.6-like [Condylostylus longicornis]|uniref:uncharacterized protein K02A2.6-like n=1 Tax=Condylostylus longicornis TaxID=2530218 RepID=UPI00244DA85E|nr:uncharacterized protein K02A2.6-like [Condylostylus longicornis]
MQVSANVPDSNTTPSKHGNFKHVEVKKTDVVRNRTSRPIKYCCNCGSSLHEFDTCPEKERGPKCFECNQFGHKKSNCPNRKQISISTQIATVNNTCIYVKANGVLFESLIDTGSDICLIKNSCLKLIIPLSSFRNTSLSISGLGATVVSKGYCKLDLEINQDIYVDVVVHIVDDNCMKMPIILGMNLLRQAIVNIDGADIKINTEPDYADLPGLSNLKKEIVTKIITMIENYSPRMLKESPIQMNIIPLDNKPMKTGIIVESSSDHASPVVLVKKKYGTHRLCVDFRAVNKRIRMHHYALPVIDDQIDKLQANSVNESIDRLRMVLDVASQNVEYLGHIIKHGTVSPSTSKTRAVRNFPESTTTKQLQSFLGLTSYLRKFIPQYSKIAKPLSDMLKKDVKFNYDDYTELHTDASKHGIAAVLLQRDPDDGELHPVHYASRKTTEAQQKWCSYELEVLAVIEAVKKFRTYLLGKHFKLVTDCKAFMMTLKKKDLATRIEHHSKQEAQKKDEKLNTIVEVLKNGPYKDFSIHHDILCKTVNGKLLYVVPDGMKNLLVATVHENGHFHHAKMKKKIEEEFYLPDLKTRIDSCLANCIHCILAERKNGKPECLLNPIPMGDKPLETFHIDLFGSMSATKKGYRF